jgi:hypothetical protein
MPNSAYAQRFSDLRLQYLQASNEFRRSADPAEKRQLSGIMASIMGQLDELALEFDKK